NVTATTFAGKFTDPNALAGFKPFSIAFLNGNLFVAYAKPSGTVTSAGGFIDQFDTSGNFIKRVFTDDPSKPHRHLNGPCGMVIAPSGFGSFGGDRLVGNFGDATGTAGNGTITAINLANDAFAGTLNGAGGTAITNPGLWGLIFGNGSAGGASNTLYFNAGG